MGVVRRRDSLPSASGVAQEALALPYNGRDFRTIRTWRGSQFQAFEELCYQLRDPTPEGAQLVKTGNPDGGLEWYFNLPSGEQWGWQAKFSFDIESLLRLMEESLQTVATTRPACRRLTFCVPFDLSDSRRSGQKSARQKFEDRKASWKARVPGTEDVSVELWSEGDLLERLVRHPHRRGMEMFFWGEEYFSQEWCARRLRTTLEAAGQRYSPALHIDLPIAFSVEGLALSETYWNGFRSARSKVRQAAKRISVSHHSDLGVGDELRRLEQLLEEWMNLVPTHVALPTRLQLERLLAVTSECGSAANAAFPPNQEEPGKKAGRVVTSSTTSSNLQFYLRNLMGALDSFSEFLNRPATKAAERGALLVTGQAGQGKTHLLCDAAERAVSAGFPAIVILGGQLSGRHFWAEVAEVLGLGNVGSEVLIGAMQAAAQAANAPFLLLVDGLNEAENPAAWQQELPALLAEVGTTPWISLGLSVRSTYQQLVFSQDGSVALPEVKHRGFDGYELEAAERFFEAYEVDHPSTPMLAPEFSNPLFLKLYCEGLAGSERSAVSADERHPSRTFDRYLRSKVARIEARLRLDPGAQPVERAVDAFCLELAEECRDSLPRSRATRTINALAPAKTNWPDTLLGQLLSEGVLAADVAWRADSGPYEVIRFTYQRFADYRIASSLLEPLGQERSTLEQALLPGRQLRTRILHAPAGWIEALSVLVPERFGVELLDAANWRLPQSTRHHWNRSFVSSLQERQLSAVNARSLELLDELQTRTPLLQRHVREAILSLAPVPGHPLNANRLHASLRALPMARRDVVWSMGTYFTLQDGGPLARLIRWAGRGPHPECPDTVAELAAIAIAWTLTSPNRRLRDYATKALGQLLSGHLRLVPDLIRRFQDVDDPYVVERLAVVSHGLLLRSGPDSGDIALQTAAALEQLVLAESQVPQIMARDALRAVYEWCQHHGLLDHEVPPEAMPPYGAMPPHQPLSEEELQRKYVDHPRYQERPYRSYVSVFHSLFWLGDFGRYVMEPALRQFSGHLLSGPRPLQIQRSSNWEKFGKRWVFQRVLSLGWTPESFGAFDTSRVPSRADHSHKPERFGKKYQWIALGELLARLADNFHLVDGYDDLPRVYSGPWQLGCRDIDPTLPAAQWRRSDDGEARLAPTFPAKQDPWWIPSGPEYAGGDSPPDPEWALDTADIPGFAPVAIRTDDSDCPWVALRAYDSWRADIPEETRYERPHRDLWSLTFSWLVPLSDAQSVAHYIEQRSLMGRWMPEGPQNIDAAYLGELPWAISCEEIDDGTNSTRGQDGRTEDRRVNPAWIEYSWEGNVRDCSIEDSVQAMLPARVLFENGDLRWAPDSRAWRTRAGLLVAQYCEARRHNALIVQENWLRRSLDKAGYALVLGWLGEKQLLRFRPHQQEVDDWTQIDGAAYLTGSGWSFGTRRLTRRSAGDREQHRPPWDTDHVRRLLRTLNRPRTTTEMLERCRLKSRSNLRERYLNPALAAGLVEMTFADEPTHKRQKYRLTTIGRLAAGMN